MNQEVKEERSLESLKLRIDKAVYAEKAFIKYSTIIIFVLIIVAIAKGTQADNTTISIFGKLEIPSTLIVKQVSIIRIFCCILILYSFTEWVMAIIDLNRHPLTEAYCKQKSFVAVIADFWDKKFKKSWLKITLLLDLSQKFLFIAMVSLLIISLFTL